jgi:hypothetical protein
LFKTRLDALIRPVSKTLLRVIYTEKYFAWYRDNIAPRHEFATRFEVYRYLVDQFGLYDDIDYLNRPAASRQS